MRRTRSPCCARAASGHATAAPPSAVSNSRRPMVTVIRPSRARCVKGRIPRHERAVFTLGGQDAGRFHPLFPPPALRERRSHRGLARRRVSRGSGATAVAAIMTRARAASSSPSGMRHIRNTVRTSGIAMHCMGLSSLRAGSFSRCGFMRDFNKCYASDLRQRHHVIVEFVKA